MIAHVDASLVDEGCAGEWVWIALEDEDILALLAAEKGTIESIESCADDYFVVMTTHDSQNMRRVKENMESRIALRFSVSGIRIMMRCLRKT